jgi:hypothetical protein
VVLRCRRESRGDEAHQAVLLEVLLLLAAFARQLEGRVDEEGAEDVEDPAEPRDRHRPDGDEDASHHEGQHDADEQRRLLQMSRDGQLAHDDDEDEEVVDRQRVLGQPAGEELAAVPGTGEVQDTQAEEDRGTDEERQVPRGLCHGRLVRAPTDDQHVHQEERARHTDRRPPDPGRDVHAGYLRTGAVQWSGGLFRPWARDRRCRAGGRGAWP